MKYLLILALYTFKAPFAPPDTVNLNAPKNLGLEIVRTLQSNTWICCMYHGMTNENFRVMYPKMRDEAHHASGTWYRPVSQGEEVTIDLPYGYYRHRWCTNKRAMGNWVKDTCGVWSPFWRVP